MSSTDDIHNNNNNNNKMYRDEKLLSYCPPIIRSISKFNIGYILRLCTRVKPRDSDLKLQDHVLKNFTQLNFCFILHVLSSSCNFLVCFLKYIRLKIEVVFCLSELIRILRALVCLQMFLVIVVCFLHCVQLRVDQKRSEKWLKSK